MTNWEGLSQDRIKMKKILLEYPVSLNINTLNARIYLGQFCGSYYLTFLPPPKYTYKYPIAIQNLNRAETMR